tara:strand:+ start:148 stop:1194 length:1047 start_codon:yes stop_codon:yes gene_type:complete
MTESYLSSIWILNYKPVLSNLKIEKSLHSKITNYIGDNQLPFNLLLNGVQGVGKFTIIKTILNQLYSPNLEERDILSYLKEYYDVPFLFYYQNIYFIDAQLSTNNNELNNILSKLNRISNFKSIDNDYKIFIILHLDKLDIKHQLRLSTILEKNINNIRFLGTSSSLIKIIPKLKGLISCLRIPPLSDKFFLSLVKKIFKNNNINTDFLKEKQVKSSLLKIYINNGKSIKQSLLMIQKIYTEKGTITYESSFTSKKILKLFDYLGQINFSNLTSIKNYMFHLLGIGLEPHQILHKLLDFIGNNKSISESKKLEIVHLFASNEMKLSKCDRDFYVMENILFNLLIILNK